MTQEEIKKVASNLRETSQMINPTRPQEVFVPLLQNYDEKYRVNIRKEIEYLLRSDSTLGYLINNNSSASFNKWLGAVRDTKVLDLKREWGNWSEACLKALLEDLESFKLGETKKDKK